MRQRIREIIRQVCAENGVEIVRGVLSSDHVHMFVSVPQKLAIFFNCSAQASRICICRIAPENSVSVCKTNLDRLHGILPQT